MIRLFIADDHEVVRAGIRRIVEEESDLQIVEEAVTGEEVLSRAPETSADILVLDLSMPGPGFLNTLEGVKKARPDLPVLVLSIYPEEVWAIQAFRAGAAGYLTKGHSSRELTAAIRRIREGGVYVTQSLGEVLAKDLTDPSSSTPRDLLSEREFQVLRQLGAGRRPKAIALSMGISPKTVSTYRARILKKLGLKNNAELVRYVLEHDLGPDPI